MTKVTKEIESLFRKVKSALGAPVRAVELTDSQLCDLLEMCIEDYSEKVKGMVKRRTIVGNCYENIKK